MTGPVRLPLPYGPETPAVRQFLVHLAGLGASDRAAVVECFADIVTTPGFAQAERVLGETIASSGRTDARDALAGPLLQLVRRPDALPTDNPTDALAGLDPIAEPALAAALALLVRDLLPPQHVTTLYAPFTRVIPPPAAPPPG